MSKHDAGHGFSISSHIIFVMLIFIDINFIEINKYKLDIDFSNTEPVFPISTAAKLLKISVHTLRMYEREGLIIPFKKINDTPV